MKLKRPPGRRKQPSYPVRYCKVEGCTNRIEPRLTSAGLWESLQNFKGRSSCGPAHRALLRQQALEKARSASPRNQRRAEKAKCKCGRTLDKHGLCPTCEYMTLRPGRDPVVQRREQLQQKIKDVEDDLRELVKNGNVGDVYVTYAEERLDTLERELGAL